MDGFQGAAMRPPVVLSIAGSDPSEQLLIW